MARSLVFALCFALFIGAEAQSESPSLTTPRPSFSLSAGNATVTSLSTAGGRTLNITTVVPTTYNISLSATSTSSPSASSTAPPTIALDTTVDPGFGVLGALLILTGIPSAFLGHRNRWTSFFLIGFYTLSLVCFVLILQFGVLQAIRPPSKTLRGLFVLSCVVAGAAGGAIAIFFWKATRFFIGAWGGLAFALFIQSMRDGGLIGPIGLRWIMFIVCVVVGFCLCTVPKIHYHVVLVSTAFVGATSFMLGVDCYTTAGLKEFYMWNIGFKALFPKFTDNNIRFPVAQTMQIELGLMAAVALMGIAVQLRILKILQRKLKEIGAEHRRQNLEAEERAAEQLVNLDREKQQWEKQHGRQPSDLSSMDILKGLETPSTLLPSNPSTDHIFVGHHSRGASDLPGGTNFRSQSPGAIPVLDLGDNIQKDVPRDYLADTKDSRNQELSPIVTADLASKETLLTEIQNIRRSIEVLRSEPSPTVSYSRRPSVTSRRTLSQDLNSIAEYRSNSQSNTRSRVQSTDLSAIISDHSGSSITRPTSVPLQDDWDRYVRDRKLLQPPSGVTPPIPTSPLPQPHRSSMSSAVLDAVAQRHKRESLLTVGESYRVPSNNDRPVAVNSSQDDPLLNKSRHLRTKSAGTIPVAILPPVKAVVSPTPQRPHARVATYEELSERHREKMREMQAPLTQAEKKQAELLAAKERWERSRSIEKEAVTRRQSLEAAAVLKDDRKRKSEDPDPGAQRRSSTLNPDKLNAVGGQSSKRMSTMKVEDWKKHQEEFTTEPPRSKRDSRVVRQPEASAVPFPNGRGPRDSRRWSSVPRDPPN